MVQSTKKAHRRRSRGREARVILPKSCDSKHLVGAILDNVELGPIVNTDGWKAYNRLSLNGFRHKRINHDNPWSMAKCISTAQRAPEAMLKAYNGASYATTGSVSEKGRSDSTIATTKTLKTTCGMHRSIGPIRLHDAHVYYQQDTITIRSGQGIRSLTE